MQTKTKALWALAALLLANAVLLVAQPALALPRSLGNYFFGPKLVRAEVLVKDGGTLTLYRVDRGIIRDKGQNALVLREQDGTIVRIEVSPTTTVTLGNRTVDFHVLRRGMQAIVIRDGDGPAVEVRATR